MRRIEATRGVASIASLGESAFVKHRISERRAALNFSELIERVHATGESFIIERSGNPLCELVPSQRPAFRGRDLAVLLRSLPKPDEGYLRIVEELIAHQPTLL